MYRITLACNGVPPEEAQSGAQDIAEEFTHREWHHNVTCEWDGARLFFQAENDYDLDGRALLDEFSDAISACINAPFDGDIEVLSVLEV